MSLLKKAVQAGGVLYINPLESKGLMYGFEFCYLEGNCSNVLFMNKEKMLQTN